MIDITPIPAFQDNYHWLISGNGDAWVVDPGDGEAVKQALHERSLALSGILITHHHWDHVNGIEALLSDNLIVAGPSLKKHPLVNTPLSNGDFITICGEQFTVFETPGHTLNHIVYYAQLSHQSPLLFCGDTLFAGGCGRLFEGTPKQMYQSLTKLAELPEDTQIYCAHEYTAANLAFASTLEPKNSKLKTRITDVHSLRKEGKPTIPSTLSVELETNPFLRTGSEEIINSARKNNPAVAIEPESIFAELRSMKDSF